MLKGGQFSVRVKPSQFSICAHPAIFVQLDKMVEPGLMRTMLKIGTHYVLVTAEYPDLWKSLFHAWCLFCSSDILDATGIAVYEHIC